MIEQLRLILKALPWTMPAVIGGFVFALFTMLLFPRRRSHTDRIGFALLVWCLVVAFVVTLSPVKNNYFGVPTRGCDWHVWTPLAREFWFSSGSRPPNVWLFIPAGIGVMLLDGVWRKILGVAFLVALPPGIEALQDLYPELKRSCASQDIVDNWAGLGVGLAVGLVLAVLVAILRAVRRAAERRRERRAAVLNGGRDAHVMETTDDAARLPLGGRADNRRYDDFSDFDDMPNSSRWYEAREQEMDARTGATSTQALPTHQLDHTPPYGTVLPDHDDGATTRFARPGAHPEAQTDPGDPDDDSTQIIPRR